MGRRRWSGGWRADGSASACFFLPDHSPDLDPDEFLDQDVKSNAVGRQRPRDKVKLMGNVRRYLWSTQRRPTKVRRTFHHPSVRYAASSVQPIYHSPQ